MSRDRWGNGKFKVVINFPLGASNAMERVATKVESFTKFRRQPGFARQYTNVYYERLLLLKDKIKPPHEWTETAKHQDRILDLTVGDPSWVIGTVTRELANKSNIFRDLKDIYRGRQPVHESKYCSPNDKVFLEDEQGRILIEGDLKHKTLMITGTIVGILGTQNQLGEFEAVDICFPSLAPQMPRAPSTGSQSGKVAFVSGLSIDETNGASLPAYQMLLEYLLESGDISRLIICGNTLSAPDEKLVGSRIMRPKTSGRSLALFDEYLSVLASTLPVHLMPGESDPTTVAFPQIPIHPALFKHARALLEGMALVLESNPQQFSINDTILLGSSGQPIRDLIGYTEETPESQPGLELDLLHHTLKWRHLAPTAPDTLYSYPYSDDDPMVLEELPHVFFCGNCTRFATDVKDNVRLICVPSFDATAEMAVLDLDTLDVDVIAFK